MALSKRGSFLYVGHSDGRLQALNFTRQSIDYEVEFDQPIVQISTTTASKNFLIQFPHEFAILTSNGAEGFLRLSYGGLATAAEAKPVAARLSKAVARLIDVADRVRLMQGGLLKGFE